MRRAGKEEGEGGDEAESAAFLSRSASKKSLSHQLEKKKSWRVRGR